MEKRLPRNKTLPLNGPLPFTLLFVLCGLTCASANQVIVPDKVNAVLGKNITLGCRIEVGSHLTQSSWVRHLRSGPITIAVYNPEFGISVSREYANRVSFLSPSVHDATIILEGVGFADIGSYTCKVSTFPLGNIQASTTVNVLDPPPTTAAPTTAASTTAAPTTAAPTTAAPTTAASLHRDTPGNSTAAGKQRAQLTSPTLASLPDSSLGTIVGGAVGGVLFLALLLVLGGVCCMRQRRTFRGDYYTKQYLGPSDMQKEAQLDVLQPHELQEVYGDKGSNGGGSIVGVGGGGKGSSQDLKPKPGGDVIYPEYPNERKEHDDWGVVGHHHHHQQQHHRAGDGHSDEPYYPEHYKNSHNVHPCGPPVHSSTVNGSPYLPEDCYDNGTDSDYVSHMDGSVISRREWYV